MIATAERTIAFCHDVDDVTLMDFLDFFRLTVLYDIAAAVPKTPFLMKLSPIHHVDVQYFFQGCCPCSKEFTNELLG